MELGPRSSGPASFSASSVILRISCPESKAYKEAGGIMRWMVRAESADHRCGQASFTEKTEDSPERLEWSPARSEMKNYLRYAAASRNVDTRC